MKKILIAGIILSLTIIITGCTNPSEKKEDAMSKLNDAKTISDVKFIGTQLDLYYSDNKKHPESLSELSSIRTTKDPHGNEYTYKRISDSDYELCFVLENDAGVFKKGKNCMNTPRHAK